MVLEVVSKTFDQKIRGSVEGWSLHYGVVSLDKKLCSTLSLFTQVYKRVPATYYWGEPCNGLASYPGGSSNTSPICVHLLKLG